MRVPNKGNPPLDEGLAAQSSEGFDEQGKHPARVERYGRAKGRALAILSHLREIDSPEWAGGPLRFISERAGLENCGTYLDFRHYYSVGKVRLHRASFCQYHLLCPLCAVRRGAKNLGRFLERFVEIRAKNPELRAYMVTLTVKNGPDLLERFNHLRRAVQAMSAARRRALAGSRHRSVFSDFAAVVGSYEFTNRGNGWHPHVHMCVLSPTRPAQDVLSAEWYSRTGDSMIVDVRPFQNPTAPEKDFAEVFKYALKFSDLSPADTIHAYSNLKGKRLLFSLGAFRGVKQAGAEPDEPLEGLPYVELFYKYLDGIGYGLESVSPPKAAPVGVA